VADARVYACVQREFDSAQRSCHDTRCIHVEMPGVSCQFAAIVCFHAAVFNGVRPPVSKSGSRCFLLRPDPYAAISLSASRLPARVPAHA